MAQLPLKIRMSLRDQWEKRDLPVHVSIQKLQDLLGLRILVNFTPEILWPELEKMYPDQTTFVPDMVTIIKQWVDTFHNRLDDDRNEAWTEKLLDGFQQKILTLTIQAAQTERLNTSLIQAPTGPSFIIAIPEKKVPFVSYATVFAEDFEKLFEESDPPASTAKQLAQEDSDWANVSLPTNSSMATSISGVSPLLTAPGNKITTLPSLDTLTRPEVLFQSIPPYIIIIEPIEDGLMIQGSHSPSLDLLIEYLIKYTRPMPDTREKLPRLKIEKKESNFGYGIMHDRFSLKRTYPNFKWLDVSPILLITFIEGVLGYQQAGSMNGMHGFWQFRREMPYAH